MVSKMHKLLLKISKCDFDAIDNARTRLINKDTAGLNIKKLRDNEYRLKVGNYRIFFSYDYTGGVIIDDIRRRTSKTYSR